MSVECNKIIKAMEAFAPVEYAEDWDNVGLLVGETNKKINTVLVSLDINDAVIDEAIEKKADLIITHHPLIFRAVKNINDTNPLGKKIIRLIKNDIAVYSAHTNLDCAKYGTNATLASLIGLKNVEPLTDVKEDGCGMGRIGELESSITFCELTEKVKAVIKAEKLSVCGDDKKIIKKIGICTGKGAGFMSIAKAMGADAYITGDFGYHEGQSAEDMDICVIDGTHYLTEVIVVPVLCDYLKEQFKEINVLESKTNGQTLKIV